MIDINYVRSNNNKRNVEGDQSIHFIIRITMHLRKRFSSCALVQSKTEYKVVLIKNGAKNENSMESKTFLYQLHLLNSSIEK
jgi:hypothetical protein